MHEARCELSCIYLMESYRITVIVVASVIMVFARRPDCVSAKPSGPSMIIPSLLSERMTLVAVTIEKFPCRIFCSIVVRGKQ